MMEHSPSFRQKARSLSSTHGLKTSERRLGCVGATAEEGRQTHISRRHRGAGNWGNWCTFMKKIKWTAICNKKRIAFTAVYDCKQQYKRQSANDHGAVWAHRATLLKDTFGPIRQSFTAPLLGAGRRPRRWYWLRWATCDSCWDVNIDPFCIANSLSRLDIGCERVLILIITSHIAKYWSLARS